MTNLSTIKILELGKMILILRALKTLRTSALTTTKQWIKWKNLNTSEPFYNTLVSLLTMIRLCWFQTKKERWFAFTNQVLALMETHRGDKPNTTLNFLSMKKMLFWPLLSSICLIKLFKLRRNNNGLEQTRTMVVIREDSAEQLKRRKRKATQKTWINLTTQTVASDTLSLAKLTSKRQWRTRKTLT